MDLRIDVAGTTSGPVVRISGELDGPRVAVLLDHYRTRPDKPPLSIADLVSADEAGLAALRYLQTDGVRIVGASPYFEYLLATPNESASGGSEHRSA